MTAWPASARILADEESALSPPALQTSIEEGFGGRQIDRAHAPVVERRIRFWLASEDALNVWVQWAGQHGHRWFMVDGESARIIDGLAGIELTGHVAPDRSMSWYGACEFERPA